MTTILGEASTGKSCRVYAIGDIHGCIDEMHAMLELIRTHLKDNPVRKHRIVFLGDYVDRGPDSRGVVKHLMKLTDSCPHITCLIGNHDDKLLMAHEPLGEEAFERYLRFGGTQTLISYGVDRKELTRLAGSEFKPKHARRLAELVRGNVSKKHVKFLKKLPASLKIGDYFFCHAGIRPGVKLSRQNRHDLLWIREPFLSAKTPYSRVIIHGHTRRRKPDIQPNRINIDTSCVYGDELTALVLEGQSYDFLTVPARKAYSEKW